MSRTATGLAFIDTETTGLGPGAQAWEVAVILRGGFEPRGEDRKVLIQIQGFDEADFEPEALAVSGFADRYGKSEGAIHMPLPAAANRLAYLLADRHLVAANPAYDASIIERMLRACRYEPPWHFRLVDVEALAMGAKAWWKPRGLQDTATALGISFDRDKMHTAMGDADLARRIHDHLIWSE
jgi:DNA polymerase III epsilon subunit-like protein